MRKKWITWSIAAICLAALVLCGALWLRTYPSRLSYGFAREIPEKEQALRLQVVETAENWLGSREGSPEHKQIIDLYNAQEVLPQSYLVTYEDNWCATFVTTVALQCGLTDIIPPECGCQRQIGLFEALGRWEEDETVVPLPGDVIYYAWDEPVADDCTGWADHVGIVVGTAGNYIKVIEGNYSDSVVYRYLHKDDVTVRGYALPDYSSKCQ